MTTLIAPSRTSVLSVYRQLLYYSGLLSGKDKELKINEIKSKFRENRNLSDNKQIYKCFEDAQKKLKFLKVITPRSPRSHRIAGKYIVDENGKLIEGKSEEKTKRQYKDHGLDIMDYNRHVHLLNRQHFGGRR